MRIDSIAPIKASINPARAKTPGKDIRVADGWRRHPLPLERAIGYAAAAAAAVVRVFLVLDSLYSLDRLSDRPPPVHLYRARAHVVLSIAA